MNHRCCCLLGLGLLCAIPWAGAESYGYPRPAGANADLALTKSASRLEIRPGEIFDYTLSVSNHGPSPAPTTMLLDILPQGLSLVSSSVLCTGITIVSCDLGSIPPGNSAVVTHTVEADGNVSGSLVNQATVSSDIADLNLSNNQASVTVFVSVFADGFEGDGN